MASSSANSTVNNRLRSAPPVRLSRDLLMRGIAQAWHEAALGGLPATSIRRLAVLVAGSQPRGFGSAAANPLLRLKPGARLVRS